MSTSGVISSITDKYGQTTVFHIGTDGLVYRFSPLKHDTSWQLASGNMPNGYWPHFKEISAALDMNGNPMCYGIDSSNGHLISLHPYGSDVVSTTSAPVDLGGVCLHISGTTHEECYAIGTDHHVYLNYYPTAYWGAPAAWKGLLYTTDPGGFVQINAGVDQYGNDEVYAVDGANYVCQIHNDQSFHWMPFQATQVSAAVGPNNADNGVYYIALDQSLHRYSPVYYRGWWLDSALGGSYLQISAGFDRFGQAECFAIDTNHYLHRYDASGSYNLGWQVLQVSAGGNDMAFVVVPSTYQVWIYDPYHAWGSFWSAQSWYQPSYTWFWVAGFSSGGYAADPLSN
jgi:hypothetical protein